MIFTIEPVQATYNAVEKRLEDMEKGNSMRIVMQRAINETATDTKNRLHSESRRQYTIKASEFKKADIKKTRATERRLEAVVRVSGPTVGIRKYKFRKNSKYKAAKAMVLTSGAMKELELKEKGKSYKAFLATMPQSGHEGIFQRVPKKTMRGNPKRQAIKELMSLSKAKASEMVYEKEVSKDRQGELRYRMLKHMNAVIGV